MIGKYFLYSVQNTETGVIIGKRIFTSSTRRQSERYNEAVFI
jgi:hypothetical protein